MEADCHSAGSRLVVVALNGLVVIDAGDIKRKRNVLLEVGRALAWMQVVVPSSTMIVVISIVVGRWLACSGVCTVAVHTF